MHYRTDGDVSVVNTWYCAGGGAYLRKYKLTFDCLYFQFQNVFKHFNIEMNQSPNYFFPSINYNLLNNQYITNINNFIGYHQISPILICNGPVLSGQSAVVGFDHIIKLLLDKYPEKIFILTAKSKLDLSKYNNIFYTSNIINKSSGSDLNEISYLSLYCNFIIGRASGPFTFTMVKENIMNPNKIILSFSKTAPPSDKFWLGNWGKNNIDYKAKCIESRETNLNKILNIIESYL